MKVIKVNDHGADFQPIDLKEVFAVLKASVKGKCLILGSERDKKAKVKKYKSLKIISGRKRKMSQTMT